MLNSWPTSTNERLLTWAIIVIAFLSVRTGWSINSTFCTVALSLWIIAVSRPRLFPTATTHGACIPVSPRSPPTIHLVYKEKVNTIHVWLLCVYKQLIIWIKIILKQGIWFFKIISYWPGQQFSLHFWVSVLVDPSTVHSAPLHWASGSLQSLVRDCSPPPQLTVQAFHSVQGPHPPSTWYIKQKLTPYTYDYRLYRGNSIYE